MEDLNLKNMTKAPKPKQNEKGEYLPNKRKVKSGLNRELLSKGLAKTINILEYKARKLGRLVVKVTPAYSSQECAKCTHTDPDNRKSSEYFTNIWSKSDWLISNLFGITCSMWVINVLHFFIAFLRGKN
ncbi:MAG: transposase [Silvanigrellaceae bacterium]|nr:transposase [Silvanigrellaceae bacterium]